MVKVTPRQIKCRSMLEMLGYSRSGASALTGNFCQEVGPNLPTAFRTAGLDHGSQGLAQWRLARLIAYKAYVQSQKPDLIQAAKATGQSLDTVFWPWYGRLDFQTQFVAKEMAQDYPALDAKLRKGGDVAALTADVCWQYERPSKALSGIANRIAYAKAIAVDTTESVSPLAEIMPQPTVVDQLHNAVLSHDSKANGGFAVAVMGAFAGAGVLLSNVIHDVPMWEWILVGVIAVIVLLAILGAIAERRNAANVAQALPGVTPVPVPFVPAPLPAATYRKIEGGPIPPIQAAVDQATFEDAVQAEVAKRLAMKFAAEQAMTASKTPPPVGDPTHTMTLGGDK